MKFQVSFRKNKKEKRTLTIEAPNATDAAAWGKKQAEIWDVKYEGFQFEKEDLPTAKEFQDKAKKAKHDNWDLKNNGS